MQERTGKQLILSDSADNWILPNKTIFDDHTQGSDFQDQQLSALEPSTRVAPLKSKKSGASTIPL
ncbi:hypothetical protein COCCADRAFT_9666 [Bipolaris zeicola 26-R-13]|uniref:Uncharacterized protein n=1 Tax=Cochliobolus carbonum (strain 26-R-13) TaxID=930089 RepID=W6XQF9_COCC2|nr:uncharacterized protein COCCADRAFT_9666 [Bipolaris zeicola 26-R-13]EUC27843.1 hypothetical protein COCCADRAFT_9666 [Bipolaris zeicola 26-R-13]